MDCLIIAIGAETPKFTLTIHSYEPSPPSDEMIQLEIKRSFAYFGLGDDKPAIRFKLQNEDETLGASRQCLARPISTESLMDYHCRLLPGTEGIVSICPVTIAIDMSSSLQFNSRPIQNSP
ncbi:hypothetical protein VNI00_006728 [Paramarasmius palmivorus]|uniref:Uncharacterized protein n=1 Tax=Paramarasmius palmivorus TaxID=297713 RepID=A0AAW0D824_9AGAR